MIGVLFLIATSAFGQRTPSVPGQLVEINGRNLHIDCRGKGTGVVFVNGVPRFSVDWILVQQEAAKFARACTWDRAADAWSEPGGQFSAAATVKDLEKVAAHASADPVVLVAHSAGGILARVFAAEHPERVRALILVDSDPSNGERMAAMSDAQMAMIVEAAKKRPPQGSPGLEPVFKKLPADAQTAHSWAIGKWWLETGAQVGQGLEYQREFGKRLLAASQKPDRLGKMPMVVISRARSADDDSDWIKQQRKLLEWSSASKLVLAVGSSHDIEVDDPAAIVTAIQSAIR